MAFVSAVNICITTYKHEVHWNKAL